MDLEKQVVSLELAKQLKELGVEQNGYWGWLSNVQGNNYVLVRSSGCDQYSTWCSAFTVAELGELLDAGCRVWYEAPIWYACSYEESLPLHKTSAGTEADAKAKLLIWQIVGIKCDVPEEIVKGDLKAIRECANRACEVLGGDVREEKANIIPNKIHDDSDSYDWFAHAVKRDEPCGDIHFIIPPIGECDWKGMVKIEYSDDVNHPDHYKAGGIETIDFIEAFGLGYYLSNAVEHISRAGRKDPETFIQDIEKARWYSERAIENDGDFNV